MAQSAPARLNMLADRAAQIAPGYSYLFGQARIAAPVEGGTEEVEAYLCLLPY
jgi:hypothetical protein